MQEVYCIKPKKLPLRSLCWEELADLLGRAHFVLGRFEALTHGIKNREQVLSLLMQEEAIHSLHYDQGPKDFRAFLLLQHADSPSKEVLQVQAYEATLRELIGTLQNTPLSLNLIKKIHAAVKIRSAMPEELGRLRTRQNWIGPEGCKIEEAYFFPPAPQQVMTLMKNLIGYLHGEERDKLVQTAIFFAQLLIIHPFMDGNGRVGRLLIPIILCKKKILSTPLFFMSSYFKTERLRYFQKLNAISEEDDWIGWIRFFLQGIIKQGEKSCSQVQALVDLHIRMSHALEASISATKLINTLFTLPIIDEKRLLDETSLTHHQASKMLQKLKRAHLVQKKAVKKEKRWIAPPLLRISKMTR